MEIKNIPTLMEFSKEHFVPEPHEEEVIFIKDFGRDGVFL